jgi:tRNA(fMet)-specific endonuclease VapC
MARYMLDTNMCIYLMKNQPKQVAERFAACFVGDVVMSAITYAELDYGVTASVNQARERQHLAALIEDIPVAAFDRAAASAYGPIRAATRERRKDHLDKLIAAHAVALDVVLVTNNERDFTCYPGLRIENWIGSGSG